MGKGNEVLVSISCITYQHKRYIQKALESFISQKIDFPVEILVHDDASTDGTAKIVRAYEKKHPDLISGLYQEENQYSKGVRVGRINLARARGKYIAVCEGDDYWIDSEKLQKQVSFMEARPECSLSVHAAYQVDPQNQKTGKVTRPAFEDRMFTTEEIIRADGGLFPTNSMVYRREARDEEPAFESLSPVGDYPLAILLSLKGQVHYLDKFMSAYRLGTRGSWTNRLTGDAEKMAEMDEKLIAMLKELDRYTQGKYKETIEEKAVSLCFHRLEALGRYQEMRHGKFRPLYRSLTKGQKAKLLLKQYAPRLARFLSERKRVKER